MSKEQTLAKVVKELENNGGMSVLVKYGLLSHTPLTYLRIYEEYKYQLENLAMYDERKRKGLAVNRCVKKFKVSKVTIYKALNLYK